VSEQSCATFPALGTTAVVCTISPEGLHRACEAVQDVVAEFDLACSRFRADSELSALNAAGGAAVRVSPLLLDAVEAALRAARLTGGAVDPTVGQALIALGYDRDFSELTTRDPQSAAALPRAVGSVPGWRTVQLDRSSATVRMPATVTLDLGATAKALAADRAAERAQQTSGGGVLVGLGGDFTVAGPAPERGWRIRVTDDHRAGTDAPGQWVTIRSGGLASSSTTVRRWQAATGSAHHVVDPASGGPAQVVWRTVSVSAASCLDANIASTAAIVRGEPALAWLQELSLPSRLVRLDGSVLHVAGWPVEGDELAPLAEATGGAS
jgi:FAD:protein FMN transferase